MIIGIDNGNANTKSVHSVFTTGLTEHTIKPPTADEILHWQDKYYTLSAKRLAFRRDKTKDDSCYILTMFALAKEILAREKYDTTVDVNLAVGLPPEYFGLQKDNFQKYFLKYGNLMTFEYNDTPFAINIKSVDVYPQAYAAVANKATSLKSYARTYIIDIGGYTVDIMLLANGKPNLEYCRSLEDGIIIMDNQIKGRVSSAFDQTIEESHILDVILDRPNILDEEVRDMIRTMVDAHAKNILYKIRELGIDLKTNPAIFIGGGAQLLQPFIEASDMTRKVEFVPNVEANAVGYELFTTASLKRQAMA